MQKSRGVFGTGDAQKQPVSGADDFPVIILAGGKSTRMGQLKGLIEYNGRPWLEAQIREVGFGGARSAIIVLGYQHVDYFAAIPWLESAVVAPVQKFGTTVRVVINPKPERGPFSSLQTGLKDLPAPTSVFVLPVDVPCPSAEVWQTLEGALKSGVQGCIPKWQGRTGHPVLISRRFVQRLLEIVPSEENARLDVQLKSLSSSELCYVEVDDARVTMNINTPDDFKTFIA